MSGYTSDEVDSIEEAAFDKGWSAGCEAERKRIIALIQERTYDSKTGNDLCWIADISNVTQSELIELIKGEN